MIRRTGDVAVVTVPDEGFCDIGRQLWSRSTKKVTFNLSLCNAYAGYFPTQEAFEVGGMKAHLLFPPGVAETITDTGVSLLKNM